MNMKLKTDERENRRFLERYLNEIIPSDDMKNYITENDILFDFSKLATIVYNSLLSFERKERLLSEISDLTVSSELKRQIQERLDYNRECLTLFKENIECCSFYELAVWIDEDDDIDVIGHYSSFESAFSQGKKMNREFKIYKYDLLDKVTEKKKIYAFMSSHLSQRYVSLEPIDNEGEAIAMFMFLASGDIKSFYSYEVAAERTLMVEDSGANRFEHKYIYLPNPFEKGDIVRIVDGTDLIGIVDTSHDEWKIFNHQIAQRSLNVEWIDDSLVILFKNSVNRDTHMHISPVFLEKAVFDENDSSKSFYERQRKIILGEMSLREFINKKEEN